VEERERERERERKRERGWIRLGAVLPVEEAKKETPGKEREEEQRRKGKETSQGFIRNFRKLQGPFCKT
jgi:hypothetical protein